MDQEAVFEDIVEFIRENGPTLPMDVASFLKKDSFIANAILSEMLSKQMIMKTNRAYGNSPIYYVEGQEEEVRKKLYEILKDNERKLIEKFAREKVLFEDELEPSERFILKKLTDFILPYTIQVKDKKLICYKIYNLKDEFFQQILKEKLELRFPKEKKEEKPIQTKIEAPKVEERPHTIIETKPKSPIKVEKQEVLKPDVEIGSELEAKAVDIIKDLGGEVISKKVVSKNKEIDFKVEMGGLIYTVKIKKKARMNESDLSLLFTQVLEEKRPMVLLTNAQISKKAREFKDKKIGDLIRILKI